MWIFNDSSNSDNCFLSPKETPPRIKTWVSKYSPVLPQINYLLKKMRRQIVLKFSAVS